MSEKGAPRRADGRIAVAAVAVVAVAGVAVLFLTRGQQDAGSPTDAPAQATMTAPDIGAAPDGSTATRSPVPDQTAPDQTAPDQTEPDGGLAPETGGDPAATDTAQQGADTAQQEPANPQDDAAGGVTAAAPVVGMEAPRFDHVRVDKDGRAVISGTAPAGVDVSIEVDGASVDTIRTDRTGQFAALLSLPQKDAAQIVGLVVRNSDGLEVRSEDSVILAPRQNAQTGNIALADAPTGGAEAAAPAGQGASVPAVVGATSPQADRPGTVSDTDLAAARQGAGEVATATPWSRSDETAQDTDHAEAMAPTVLLASRTGVELLQPANDVPERLRDRVVIDVISYSDDGSVALEGRAAANADRADRVQVYLNNKPVQSARVSPDGRWRLRLPQVAPGVYTLRVDQVAPDGRVVARFETPFKREDPSELARLVSRLDASGAIGASVITVQPGYTLWGIATDRYGNGLDYVQIFETNRSQIRDPDLIYPGQIFELPDMPEQEGANGGRVE